MKIEHTNAVASLDVKRCYLPIIITDTCPTCGVEVSKHIESDYLMYPKLNTPFEVSMYHHIEHDVRDEEHDWKVKVILRVHMEPAP
jgi:hypothetical protein